MGITVVLSLVIAVALFMLLPYFLAGFLTKVVANETLLALFEGLIRLIIFLLYVSVDLSDEGYSEEFTSIMVQSINALTVSKREEP